MLKETITKNVEIVGDKYKRVYEVEEIIDVKDLDAAIDRCDMIIKQEEANKVRLKALKTKCLATK